MEYIIALAPTIGAGVLFYLLMRMFLTADRRERAAQVKIDAEVQRRLESNPVSRAE